GVTCTVQGVFIASNHVAIGGSIKGITVPIDLVMVCIAESIAAAFDVVVTGAEKQLVIVAFHSVTCTVQGVCIANNRVAISSSVKGITVPVDLVMVCIAESIAAAFDAVVTGVEK